MSRLATRVIVAAVGLALVAGCGPSEDAAAEDVEVVVTTSVLGDVVTEIVGDDGTVVTLMPRGADPHDFQASPAQVADVRGADLVVANGLGLEEGLLSVLDAAAADGVPVLELAPDLEPIGGDPHVWLDPLRMVDGVGLIAEELARRAPEVDWVGRAEPYAEELLATHEEVVRVLDAVPPGRRQLVVDHDSFQYFAQRYDFAVLGTVVPGTSPLAAPSPDHLAALAATVRDERIPAVFVAEGESDTAARALAREAGTAPDVVRLHVGSLGPADSEAGTYRGLLLDNARRIADALEG